MEKAKVKDKKSLFKKEPKEKKVDVKTDKKEKFRLIFSIGFFVFLLLSLFRVPVIGEFFDAIFFSFLFGWAKYAIYIYGLTIIILYWAKKLKKPMYSKRTILLLIVTSFLLSCFFSSIYDISQNVGNNTKVFTDYFNYWWATIFPSNLNNFNPFVDASNKLYIDGGIIGVSINYLSNLIVLILSIVGLFVTYLIVATKHREKLFSFFRKKMGNNTKIDKIIAEVNNTQDNTETSNEEANQTGFIVDDSYLNKILEDPKKTHLTLDGTSSNKQFDIERLKINILQFFSENNLTFIKSSVEDNAKSFTIDFLIDDDTYAAFRNLKESFKVATMNLDYNITYDSHTLSIIFNKQVMLSNALMMKNLHIALKNAFDVAFIDMNNVPLVINLRKNPLIGVFDGRDNNITNLINNIIYNFSWSYKTQQLKIYYLSTKATSLESFNAPNFVNTDLTTVKDSIKFLKALVKENNDLIKDFKKKSVQDIYSYNALVKEPVPNKVILINEIHQLCTIDADFKNYLNELIKQAPICGITIITFDRSIDAISYNNFEYPISLLFKSTIEVSKKITNDSNAINLTPVNHAILYNNNSQKSYEIQVPNVLENDGAIILEALKKCEKENNF